MQEGKLTVAFLYCPSRGALYAALVQYHIERISKNILPERAASLDVIAQPEKIEREIHQTYKKFEM